MVPHKAWAAGDTLCALVKFSPLNKGIRITGITTSLHEHLKTFGRSGSAHDENRIACSVKHEIHDGRAVAVPYFSIANSFRWSQSSSQSPFSTGANTPSASDGARTPFSEVTPPSTSGTSSNRVSLDVRDTAPISRDTSEDAPFTTASLRPSPAPNRGDPSSSSPDRAPIDIGEQEIVTTLELPLPTTLTPSHAVEPVLISHRLRWNILLSNPDGHVSELRCSLPVHILDHSVLEDARAATRVTRRLLFGLEAAQEGGDEIQLPSYPSHVMDRVPDDEQATAALANAGNSGSVTPTELDWVNTQLLSEGQRSQTASPPDSRIASRASSRAPSPERRERERGHHGFFSSLKPFTKVTSPFGNHSRQNDGLSQAHADNNSNNVNESSSSSLSLTLSPSHGSAIETISIPLTPNSSQPGTPSSSHPSSYNLVSQRRPPSASISGNSSPRNASIALPNTLDDEVAVLSRVPHYGIASRGFLSGITPISSLRGLPSYEEASRPSRTTAASPVSSEHPNMESSTLSRSLGRQLSALSSIQSSGDLGRRSAAERSLSEGDLAGRFADGLSRRR